MAPSYEVTRYGNRSRHRIKSGGRTRPTARIVPYNKLEYGNEENVYYKTPIRVGEEEDTDRQKWETSLKQKGEDERAKKTRVF